VDPFRDRRAAIVFVASLQDAALAALLALFTWLKLAHADPVGARGRSGDGGGSGGGSDRAFAVRALSGDGWRAFVLRRPAKALVGGQRAAEDVPGACTAKPLVG
jgi:hypothetical protein